MESSPTQQNPAPISRDAALALLFMNATSAARDP